MKMIEALREEMINSLKEKGKGKKQWQKKKSLKEN